MKGNYILLQNEDKIKLEDEKRERAKLKELQKKYADK